MTNDERDVLLREMHAKLSMVVDLSNRHDKSLYGNGQPGLASRVISLEERHAQCPAMLAFGNGNLIVIPRKYAVLLALLLAGAAGGTGPVMEAVAKWLGS